MKVTKNLTEGNIYKNYLLYALPLILSSLLSTVYSTVDAMIAGKCISDHAIGAVSATGSFDTLFYSCFNGFSAGFSIYVAYLFGRGDYARLKRDVIHQLTLVGAVSLVISALAIVFRGGVISYLKVDPILRRDAELYFVIHTSSYVFSFSNLLMLSALRSLGVTSYSLYVSLGSALLNIGGNLLTVLVFGMGVEGLALSTVLSIVAASGFYIVMLRRAFRELPCERVSYRFSLSGFRASLRYTMPAAVQQVAFHGVSFILAPTVNALGAAATTGYNISMRLYNLSAQSIWNTTASLNCYTAQCVGAGRLEKIRRGLAVGLLLNCLMLLPFVALTMLLAEPLVSLFFRAGFDGAAAAYAIHYARTYMPFLYVNMAGHLLHSYMRSLGKVSVVLGITLVGSCVQITSTLSLVPSLGMDGVFLGQVISWTADALLSALFYLLLYRTIEQIRRAVRSAGK